jgi:2-hydroxychromene-2-carboxylate isomerase
MKHGADAEQTQSLALYFDFAMPECYFAYRLAAEYARAKGMRIEFFPVLLGARGNASGRREPLDRKSLQRRCEEFAVSRRLGRFQFNSSFPFSSLIMMRGAAAAITLGIADQYVGAVFRGAWEERREIERGEEFAAALRGGGIAPEIISRHLSTPQTRHDLIASTQRFREIGASCLPAIYVAGSLVEGFARLSAAFPVCTA